MFKNPDLHSKILILSSKISIKFQQKCWFYIKFSKLNWKILFSVLLFLDCYHNFVWQALWKRKKAMFCTNCGIEVNEEGLFCSSCGSKIVINYKQEPPGTNDEKELISYYFRKGYKYKTIALLSNSGTILRCLSAH